MSTLSPTVPWAHDTKSISSLNKPAKTTAILAPFPKLGHRYIGLLHFISTSPSLSPHRNRLGEQRGGRWTKALQGILATGTLFLFKNLMLAQDFLYCSTDQQMLSSCLHFSWRRSTRCTMNWFLLPVLCITHMATKVRRARSQAAWTANPLHSKGTRLSVHCTEMRGCHKVTPWSTVYVLCLLWYHFFLNMFTREEKQQELGTESLRNSVKLSTLM